jgi:hypothetical protein
LKLEECAVYCPGLFWWLVFKLSSTYNLRQHINKGSTPLHTTQEALGNGKPITHRNLTRRSNGWAGVRTLGLVFNQVFERLPNRSNGFAAWCKLILHLIPHLCTAYDAPENKDPSTYRDLNRRLNGWSNT